MAHHQSISFQENRFFFLSQETFRFDLGLDVFLSNLCPNFLFIDKVVFDEEVLILKTLKLLSI